MRIGNRRRWPWYERVAGYAVAMIIVPSLLIAMRQIMVPTVEDEEVETLKVLYQYEEPEPQPEVVPEPLPEPEPEPAEELPLVEPLMFEPTAATRVDSQEMGELILDPQEADVPDFEVAEPGEQSESLADWVPTTQEAAEIQAMRQEISQVAEQLKQRQRELQGKITRAEVVSAAKDFELNSDGGLEGAIRLLDVEHFPQEIVLPVLERYGIKYERRYTAPTAGRSYLNAATTDKGTYRDVKSEGYYEVMTLSAKAVSFMAMAETEALMDRGYNPRTTRVRKIVFGIVKIEDTYALGVTDLEVERIR